MPSYQVKAALKREPLPTSRCGSHQHTLERRAQLLEARCGGERRNFLAQASPVALLGSRLRPADKPAGPARIDREASECVDQDSMSLEGDHAACMDNDDASTCSRCLAVEVQGRTAG